MSIYHSLAQRIWMCLKPSLQTMMRNADGMRDLTNFCRWCLKNPSEKYDLRQLRDDDYS